MACAGSGSTASTSRCGSWGPPPRAGCPSLPLRCAPPLPARHPFAARISGAGSFPATGRPRTLWLGLTDGADALAALAAGLDTALVDAGWAHEAPALSGSPDAGPRGRCAGRAGNGCAPRGGRAGPRDRCQHRPPRAVREHHGLRSRALRQPGRGAARLTRRAWTRPVLGEAGATIHRSAERTPSVPGRSPNHTVTTAQRARLVVAMGLLNLILATVALTAGAVAPTPPNDGIAAATATPERSPTTPSPSESPAATPAATGSQPSVPSTRAQRVHGAIHPSVKRAVGARLGAAIGHPGSNVERSGGRPGPDADAGPARPDPHRRSLRRSQPRPRPRIRPRSQRRVPPPGRRPSPRRSRRRDPRPGRRRRPSRSPASPSTSTTLPGRRQRTARPQQADTARARPCGKDKAKDKEHGKSGHGIVLVPLAFGGALLAATQRVRRRSRSLVRRARGARVLRRRANEERAAPERTEATR